MTNQPHINTMIDTLGNFELELAEMVGDEMDKCEEWQKREGIKRPVYPEDAAPDLDSARTLIQDAIHHLQQFTTYEDY